MEKKRILMVTMEYPPMVGGIASYVDDVAEALQAHHEVTVVAPLLPKGKTQLDTPYRVIRTPFLFPRGVWPRWLRLFFFLLKLTKAESFDVVMLHHILPVGYVALLLKRFRKLPYIIFSHGTDIVAAQASSWKKQWATTIGINAKRIIANSESLKERMIRAFPALHGNIDIMYPCPDARFLTAPKEEEIAGLRHQYGLEGKKVILTIARLEPEKGIEALIETIPTVLQSEPHTVWFLVGDGSKRDAILAKIREHNLHHIVRYVGAIQHEQLTHFYALADVFALLPVPYQGREEGLGLVFLEAAAAGLPVVAGRSGGVPEAVVHEQTGYVFDAKTEQQAIARAIIRLLGDKGMAMRFGQSGQARIHREFQWPHQIRILDAILAE